MARLVLVNGAPGAGKSSVVHLLRSRLAGRIDAPNRPEHHVNNRLVGPGDAERLVESIDAFVAERPATVRVDARGALGPTLEQVRAAVDGDHG